MAELKRSLGLWDVVLLNVVAIVGLRWLPVAAQTGPSSIMLWGLAFLVFFVPSGFTVVELTTRFPDEGGIYVWTKRTFGEFNGFVCGWCYWVNNLFYYPTILISAAGIAVYLGGTAWLPYGDNKLYVSIFTLILMWVAVIVNVLGLDISKWVQNLGAFGNWIPALVIIVLGGFALAHYGSATTFSSATIVPPLFKSGLSSSDRFSNLNFWSTMCFAFAGLELASTMSGEVRDVRRTIPRAIVISGVAITLIYILGTISLLVAVPSSDLNVISGVPQVVADLSNRFHLSGLTRPVALLMVLGSLGGTSAWFAGSARIPFVAGLDKVMPPTFGKLHPRYGTPYVTIIIQGTVSTIILLMSALGKDTNVGNFYLALVDMSIIVYFVPYLYLFLVLIVLHLKQATNSNIPKEVIRVPGGKPGAILCGSLGFLSTLIAIVLATFPPDDVAKQPVTTLGLAGLKLTLAPATFFRLKVIGGCLIFILIGAVFYWLSPGRRVSQPAGSSE